MPPGVAGLDESLALRYAEGRGEGLLLLRALDHFDMHVVVVCDGAAWSAVFALDGGLAGAVFEGPDTAAEAFADAAVASVGLLHSFECKLEV